MIGSGRRSNFSFLKDALYLSSTAFSFGGFDKLLYFWKRLLYATFCLIEAINKFFL